MSGIHETYEGASRYKSMVFKQSNHNMPEKKRTDFACIITTHKLLREQSFLCVLEQKIETYFKIKPEIYMKLYVLFFSQVCTKVTRKF